MKAQRLDPNRLYWIDAIRSFACLCVITTHAPMPGLGEGYQIKAVYNYFSIAGASILFFMISGALVLYKPKPVIPFLKKRLSRIVFPMVFWTIVSLLIEVAISDMTWSEFCLHIIKIPIGPQVGTYWFIYVIFGIYLLTPILATWFERCSKKDLQLYLGLWGVTLLLPYFSEFKVMVDFEHGYLHYFYGYLWFAVMGYYIRRYVNIPHFKWWHYAVFAGLVILPGILYLTPMDHRAIQNRMALHVVALCICYFIILKHFKYSNKMKHLCFKFAQHSFGIYLVHIIVMRKFLWPMFDNVDVSYAIQVPLITLLTAVISYFVIRLFSYLPNSKYIVGV